MLNIHLILKILLKNLMYSVYSMYSTGTYIAKITTINYCKVHVHKIM